jgi:hypothetical protein
VETLEAQVPLTCLYDDTPDRLFLVKPAGNTAMILAQYSEDHPYKDFDPTLICLGMIFVVGSDH